MSGQHPDDDQAQQQQQPRKSDKNPVLRLPRTVSQHADMQSPAVSGGSRERPHTMFVTPNLPAPNSPSLAREAESLRDLVAVQTAISRSKKLSTEFDSDIAFTANEIGSDPRSAVNRLLRRTTSSSSTISPTSSKVDEVAAAKSASDQQLPVSPTRQPQPSETKLEVSTHADEVSESDLVDIKGGLRVRIGQFLDLLVGPSTTSKHCQQVYRSVQSIRREQRRQKAANRFIIHPYSLFRHIWDALMVVTLLITLFILPIDIAFYSIVEPGMEHDEHAMFISSLTLECIFMLDIILNFRTAYIKSENDTVVLNNRKIIFHYLSTWFIWDLISVVPIDVIYAVVTGEEKRHENHADYLNLRLSRLLKILCLLRILRVMRYLHHLEVVYLQWSRQYIQMINVVIALVLAAHWNGCLQYIACVAQYYPNFPDNCWIYMDHLTVHNVTVLHKYTRSLFRALSQMLAMNYGQSVPQTTVETWIVICSMLLGCIFYALFLSFMSSLIAGLNLSEKKYNEAVSELQEFMRFHKVPRRVQRRVFHFFQQKFRHNFFNEDKILHSKLMSSPLREAIAMHTWRRLVERVSFFSGASPDFLYQVISHLEFQVYFPGDVIVRGARRYRNLYLIAHGRVDFLSHDTDAVVHSLNEGHCFGEVALLFDEHDNTDAVAADVCDIYKLSKKQFDDILEFYPEIRQSVTAVVARRRARIAIADAATVSK